MIIRRPVSTMEDLRSWTKINPATGCWEWTRHRQNDGYGGTRFRGREVLTHRLSWELANGPIPAGLLVCHHCDNRICCNPDHLFLGTNLDNMRDMKLKKRYKLPFLRGEQLSYSVLKESDVRKVIEARLSGMGMPAIGKQFGVTRTAISQILNGNTWVHVTNSCPFIKSKELAGKLSPRRRRILAGLRDAALSALREGAAAPTGGD